MPKKACYYAVRAGRKTGILESHEEYIKATKGYARSESRKFNSLPEAELYMYAANPPASISGIRKAFNHEIAQKSVSIGKEDFLKEVLYETDVASHIKKRAVVAYTDGSFNEKKSTYGIGALVFTPSNVIVEISGCGSNKSLASLQNISGELLAAATTIDWAISHAFKSIVIFYDFDGVGRWADGILPAKNTIAQCYREVIHHQREQISIKFIKVKGHSKNPFNNRADTIAKKAAENIGAVISVQDRKTQQHVFDLLCAEKDGRLKILPCEEGAIVYCIEKVSPQGCALSEVKLDIVERPFALSMLEAYGRTVFGDKISARVTLSNLKIALQKKQAG